MDQDTSKRLAELEAKVDAIYASVEKTRKYFLWTMIVTIAVVVLPAIALAFALPSFIGNYTETINSLVQ